jgi:hypothetical protein
MNSLRRSTQDLRLKIIALFSGVHPVHSRTRFSEDDGRFFPIVETPGSPVGTAPIDSVGPAKRRFATEFDAPNRPFLPVKDRTIHRRTP